MKISEVRVRKVENNDDSKLKAVASVTIDECFVIHDIKIIKGESGMFIAMPSKKDKNGDFKDIAHPINPATRQELSNAIIKAFKDTI